MHSAAAAVQKPTFCCDEKDSGAKMGNNKRIPSPTDSLQGAGKEKDSNELSMVFVDVTDDTGAPLSPTEGASDTIQRSCAGKRSSIQSAVRGIPSFVQAAQR